MRRLSIARSLRLTLVGLTLVLAVVAALGVASLYHARQRYEDRLAASSSLAAASANLLAAGVVEEAILRQAPAGAAGAPARSSAQASYERAAGSAATLAADDVPSARLVTAEVAAQAQLRAAAARGRAQPLGSALARIQADAAALARRQRDRQSAARATARSDSRAAIVRVAVAGALALIAALGLVSLLVGAMRVPLDALVRATRRLSTGDLARRVEPAGPRELQDLGAAFNQMSDDLASARARIDEERRRLAVTIESLGDALLVCSPDGTIDAANPRAASLVPELRVGDRVDAPGSPLPPLAEASGREVFLEHGGRALAVVASPLAADGQGVVWTVRDVSERARLEQAKSDFVATASHELRSPLTSIKGFAELLARGSDLSERQREAVDIIVRSADRLVDLVNDLLDVASIDAGGAHVSPRPLQLAEPVAEVLELMGPRVAERGQELASELPDDLPEALADPARVRQIVANLVTNAHLYTDEGGRIAVRLEARAQSVAIVVEDSGRGMAPDELERVFERFYRGARGASAAPGSGLGLPIVKSLVELQGGGIAIESAVGEGTTVTVTLPLATGAPDAGEEPLATAQPEGRTL